MLLFFNFFIAALLSVKVSRDQASRNRMRQPFETVLHTTSTVSQSQSPTVSCLLDPLDTVRLNLRRVRVHHAPQENGDTVRYDVIDERLFEERNPFHFERL